MDGVQGAGTTIEQLAEEEGVEHWAAREQQPEKVGEPVGLAAKVREDRASGSRAGWLQLLWPGSRGEWRRTGAGQAHPVSGRQEPQASGSTLFPPSRLLGLPGGGSEGLSRHLG